jgi:hypothetical protein
MSERISAFPSKAYFINMITKDIALEDSILDLIDNCLDGARRQICREKGEAVLRPIYEGYEVKINLDENQFSIEDNCGGIPDDAFHFGKPAVVSTESKYSLGLYGLGMKRAIFKIGQHIRIQSSTKTAAFSLDIDVNRWAENANDWDFEIKREEKWANPGTRIEIQNLHERISKEFAITTVFANRLSRIIARDYVFPLHDGFSIIVNGYKVKPYDFRLRESEVFRPQNSYYVDEFFPDVSIKILAGFNDLPPDDASSNEAREELRHIPYMGWFVACNGRIVLAGDKSKKTVWGNGGFYRWHTQYHGFLGIISFYAADPKLLPWTTTKRDLNLSNPLYLRALIQMENATRRYIHYTNERKEDLTRAKAMEKQAALTPITQLAKQSALILPHLSKFPTLEMAEIKYYKPKRDVIKVKAALDAPFITNSEAGAYIFDDFLETEAITTGIIY